MSHPPDKLTSRESGAGALQFTVVSFGQMATADGEMHLVHRGGYKDLPNVYTEVFGLTGIYAAESQLSNGYGTLDQAGWTTEEEMTDVAINVNSPISMASDETTLTLVWADANSKTIQYKQGKYS